MLIYGRGSRYSVYFCGKIRFAKSEWQSRGSSGGNHEAPWSVLFVHIPVDLMPDVDHSLTKLKAV
jgi:hypothetical protein